MEINSKKTITISYPEDPKIDSAYNISPFYVTLQYVSDVANVSSTRYIAQSGTLTIKSYDKANSQVEGTFFGIIENTSNSNDTIVVTNGEFGH